MTKSLEAFRAIFADHELKGFFMIRNVYFVLILFCFSNVEASVADRFILEYKDIGHSYKYDEVIHFRALGINFRFSSLYKKAARTEHNWPEVVFRRNPSVDTFSEANRRNLDITSLLTMAGYYSKNVNSLKDKITKNNELLLLNCPKVSFNFSIIYFGKNSIRLSKEKYAFLIDNGSEAMFIINMSLEELGYVLSENPEFQTCFENITFDLG